MTPQDVLYPKHSRVLDKKQREWCQTFAQTRAEGTATMSVTHVAAKLQVTRATVYTWMRRDDLGQPLGPKVGTRYKQVPEALKQDIATWRAQGYAFEDIHDAIQLDYPEEPLSRYRLRQHARAAKWAPLHRTIPPRVVRPFLDAPPGFAHADLIIAPNINDPVILVLVLRDNRWVDALPLPSKHAAVIQEGLAKLFARCPLKIRVLLTDCGSEFRGAVDPWLAGQGIEHRRTKPYTPQTNGLVERMNALLKTVGPLSDPGFYDRQAGETPRLTDRDPSAWLHRQLSRMAYQLERWCLWRNLVRPNRPIGRQTPWSWALAHPDQCVESVLETILERRTRQSLRPMTHSGCLAHAPPATWYPQKCIDNF